MKELRLTKGYIALVDDEDYERVSAFKWSAVRGGRTIYACRWHRSAGKVVSVPLHRFILGVTDGEIEVDHADGNGLNNQKENLRQCTHKQNLGNSRVALNNTSGFKGVYAGHAGKWVAKIKHNYKQVYLGTFETREAAAKAYDHAALELFGEFAHTNF